MLRNAIIVVGLIFSTTASARPNDQQTSAFMACMRNTVPVIGKHAMSSSTPQVLAVASEICRGNMPSASDREDVVLDILECGLEPDGSDASPDSCLLDGPDAMYPKAKPAKAR